MTPSYATNHTFARYEELVPGFITLRITQYYGQESFASRPGEEGVWVEKPRLMRRDPLYWWAIDLLDSVVIGKGNGGNEHELENSQGFGRTRKLFNGG